MTEKTGVHMTETRRLASFIVAARLFIDGKPAENTNPPVAKVDDAAIDKVPLTSLAG